MHAIIVKSLLQLTVRNKEEGKAPRRKASVDVTEARFPSSCHLLTEKPTRLIQILLTLVSQTVLISLLFRVIFISIIIIITFFDL